ncbi:MAG TPA: hypothetical protein VG502_18380 [Flexivirga sp.]|uniref:hypothetical protein n=1 Tax=Flexivirga sp. TaxID=1962927 RepID=UPI002CDF9E29|nr:hypothetical protein [Flexivirga sp.]HWC24267.1 hypothetical protein [Flexivirga sp.]
MPSTRPDRPQFLGTWWEKTIAVVVLIAGALLVLQWWQGRQPSGPARPGMAPATVVSEDATKDGRAELTVRYSVDGHSHKLTKSVDAAAFSAQGKVAWVCYAPGDAGDASIRLPQDPLCGQK